MNTISKAVQRDKLNIDVYDTDSDIIHTINIDEKIELLGYTDTKVVFKKSNDDFLLGTYYIGLIDYVWSPNLR